MRNPFNSSTELLLERALQAADHEGPGSDGDLLALLVALLRRPEPAVCETALAWCRSSSAVQRALASRILAGVGETRRLAFLQYRSRALWNLKAMLRHRSEEVVSAAVLALGRLTALPLHESALSSLARHHSENVRYAVAAALGGNESPSAIATLVELSRDEDPDVRDWAVFGLGSMCDLDTPAIREALWARVGDPHDDTRAEAQLGLARRRDLRVLEPLRNALQSSSVGTLSVEAAMELATSELLPALEGLRDWWDVDTELLEEAIARCKGATPDRR